LTTPRIYLPGEMNEGDIRTLDRETRHYLKTVLRMKAGESLRLFNGTGMEYEALIRGTETDGAAVEIIKKRALPAQPISVTLAQGLPKADKMDFIIQKAAELGAHRIIPFPAARSVPRLTPERAEAKRTRWQKIALEAARKCGRDQVPEISPVTPFAGMLAAPDDTALKLFFWEEETGTGFREIMHADAYRETRDFYVVVGPEGGFTKEEAEMAMARGFISVSLGKQVLKVDTAALAVLSILQYERGTERGRREQG
jgi:16S rRNA (uracil1498-N3)-methyltransferase